MSGPTSTSAVADDAVSPTSPQPAPLTATRTRRGTNNRRATNVGGQDNSLVRVASGNSTYSFAGASLRRMATHETGEYVEETDDRRSLHTHDEEHEHDHDHEHDEGHERAPVAASDSREAPMATGEKMRPVDEEAAVGGESSATPEEEAKAKKYELQDQTNLLPAKQVIMIFCGLNCALFCSLLDQTIVTTALPTLGRVFNEASIATWVGTAYMLTSTALQPVYGRLSDIFGRKVVLLGSLTIFLFGSLACALAQTMIELIVFRAIQGLGGGGILTLSMIIISDIVSLKDRGKFQGFTGGVVAIANSVGPILGGIFTEKVTWRWCFYINLPLTALAIVVVTFLLPLKKIQGSWIEKLKKLDFYGSILTLAWAILVLLALSWSGTTYSWTSAAVLAPLIIGVALLVVFIIVEAKVVPLPLVPMYIFKDMTVAASMATTFCNGAAFYATLYYLPQYFQVVRGDSPIRSGINMLPLTFVQVFFSFSSGMLVSKTGDYKWNLMAGFFIWTIGLGLMSSMKADTPMAHIYGFQVLVGVGAGQTFQTSLIAIQASVARKDMATATGCRNFLRMLGGTVALAACAAIVNNIAKSRLNKLDIGAELVAQIIQDPTQLAALGLSADQVAQVRAIYAHGVDACFWLCVPMAGISFFITVFFVKRISLKREDDAQLKAAGKAWVQEEKARKRAKHGHGSEDDHEGGASAAHSGISDRTLTFEDEVVKDLEAAGKGMEEAAVGVRAAPEKH